MSARQFAEWWRFFGSEPDVADRVEIMVAQLCSLTANIYRKKGADAFKASDFMLERRSEREIALAEARKVESHAWFMRQYAEAVARREAARKAV